MNYALVRVCLNRVEQIEYDIRHRTEYTFGAVRERNRKLALQVRNILSCYIGAHEIASYLAPKPQMLLEPMQRAMARDAHNRSLMLDTGILLQTFAKTGTLPANATIGNGTEHTQIEPARSYQSDSHGTHPFRKDGGDDVAKIAS